jgi:transcriptional regulator with XRE-family HTH domain
MRLDFVFIAPHTRRIKSESQARERRTMRTAKKTAATNARSFRTFLLMQQFDSQAIGARIAQARREANGMTQETLGDLIGLSKRSVQDYEAGATIPWKHLREMARVLDKHVDWFLRGIEPDGDSPSPDALARLERRVEELQGSLRDLQRFLREKLG